MARFNRYRKSFKRYRKAYLSYRSRPRRRRRSRSSSHSIMKKKVFGMPLLLVLAGAAYLFIPAVKTFVSSLISKLTGKTTA